MLWSGRCVAQTSIKLVKVKTIQNLSKSCCPVFAMESNCQKSVIEIMYYQQDSNQVSLILTTIRNINRFSQKNKKYLKRGAKCHGFHTGAPWHVVWTRPRIRPGSWELVPCPTISKATRESVGGDEHHDIHPNPSLPNLQYSQRGLQGLRLSLWLQMFPT